MKLKNILIILIVLVIVPEILFTVYVFNINTEVPSAYANDFLLFLINNPFFSIISAMIIFVSILLYFALKP